MHKLTVLTLCLTLGLSLGASTSTLGSGFPSTQKIEKLSSASECALDRFPAYSPFAPRPISGTQIAGRPAELMMKTLYQSGGDLNVWDDPYLDPISTVTLPVRTVASTAPTYPNSGCTRTATLYDQCSHDLRTDAVKCAQFCSFYYHCVDER